MNNVVEIFLLGWLLGGFVANVITIIVQKAKYVGGERNEERKNFKLYEKN